MTKVTDTMIVNLCDEFNYDVPLMAKALRERIPGYEARPKRITDRINKLRTKGVLPLDSGNYVSSGEVLKGSSTLYDEVGNVKLQWVKTDIDKQTTVDAIKELVGSLSEELPQLEKTEYKATNSSKDLMAVYPLGDAHIGMLARKDEAGEDWDLKDSQKVLCGVFDRLVKTAPSCDEAVIVNLGDYFHRDNAGGFTTRSNHQLDTDGNYLVMADTGMKIMIQMINSALEHHKHVRIINAIGNHDDVSSMFLQVALKHMYEHEPRVTVDCTAGSFQYFQHGKCFFGVHHGHECKADKLPLVMASDKPLEWGNSSFRHWLVGHIHHDSRKEYSGCTVESFRTTAGKDKYAYSHGYRAMQDSKALVYHKNHGEVERHTVNVTQVLDT